MAFWLGKFQKIVNSIIPPGSMLELFFRTLYHKARATSFFTTFTIERSHKSYAIWLEAQNQWLRTLDIPTAESRILTFILPVSDFALASRTIQSIQKQRSESWQLLIIIENSAIKEEAIGGFLKDSKISFFENSYSKLSALISKCQSDYFLLCKQGDFFSELFVELIQRAHQKSFESSVFYCDVETQPSKDGIARPMFKAPKYSPEQHLSTNYLSRAVVSTQQAKIHQSEIDVTNSIDIQEWELLLLLGKEPQKFCHIPYVLISLSSYRSSDSQEYRKLIKSFLSHRRLQAVDVEMHGKIPRIQWKSEQPLISIIIPTKNNFQKLKTLLDSLFTLTDYPAYEIILVDTGSTDQRIFGYYEDVMRSRPVQMLRYDQPFNYSKVNNLGAGLAKGALLLFLNDDMQVLDKDWLSELSQWALRDEIGVVGTKLIHPSGRIQHIGIVIGMQGFVGHLYRNAPEHYWGLMGSSDWYRNISAVTGACQMIRKDLFWELGGFDEQYELVTGDITLCLKALKLGYRNLYTPHATLLHHEGASRGYQTPVEDILRGYEEMDDILRSGDPYFSPNLTLEPIPRCEMNSWRQGHRSQKYLERKNYYLAHRSKPDKEK